MTLVDSLITTSAVNSIVLLIELFLTLVFRQGEKNTSAKENNIQTDKT